MIRPTAPRSEKIAALATRNHEFYAGRVFDAESIRAMRPSLQPMAWPWLHVHNVARERGLRLVTADRVGADARDVLLVAYDWTPDAASLVERGAKPAALVSFEPPVIAWQLYADLPRLSRSFTDIFLFEGARPRVAAGTRFHSLRFPQSCPPQDVIAPPWGERRFLCMINSNKALARVTSPARWLDRPREVSLKRTLAALRYPPIARDQYWQRLHAIASFADRSDFDLFGEGWDRRHPAVRLKLHARALKAYRGTVDDKLATLAGYKFALAIENTRFSGYVSEKLFDCFVAGTIPIYDGAPDITRYVPVDAFIDSRSFSDFRELERYLRDMPEAVGLRLIERGREFLESPAYQRFCATAFARELVDALLAVGQE